MITIGQKYLRRNTSTSFPGTIYQVIKIKGEAITLAYEEFEKLDRKGIHILHEDFVNSPEWSIIK
jgi:hypothetical protein